MSSWQIPDEVSFDWAMQIVFAGPEGRGWSIPASWQSRVEQAEQIFRKHLDSGAPIYGVTTGFGDSCFRRVAAQQSEELQANLVKYLRCGSGPLLRREVRRATCLFRYLSLARGYSGVSRQLLQRMEMLLSADALPLIPAEGSLGASGDLVPLAYLAAAVQGEGEVETPQGVVPAAAIFSAQTDATYRLKPKEGLALVNGTSAMAGQAFVNLHEAESLASLGALESAWMCLAVQGQQDPFSETVNSVAKQFPGQASAAARVRDLLAAESYRSTLDADARSGKVVAIQDRYSLRCSPQILGPVFETIWVAKGWVEKEINGVSDNPLVAIADERLVSGGNFYGGYLSHAMDYLKISLSHLADMLDRQIALLVDDKVNRGLPANLADWNNMAAEDRHLHHGLKGLHQAISAITAEILSRSLSVGIFSRSSESHNQDKVSMGMGAAVTCEGQLDALFRIHAMSLICLAQALDLRGVKLKGSESQFWYEQVRQVIPFVKRDQPLDLAVKELSKNLRTLSHQGRIHHVKPI